MPCAARDVPIRQLTAHWAYTEHSSSKCSAAGGDGGGGGVNGGTVCCGELLFVMSCGIIYYHLACRPIDALTGQWHSSIGSVVSIDGNHYSQSPTTRSLDYCLMSLFTLQEQIRAIRVCWSCMLCALVALSNFTISVIDEF